MSRVKGKDTRPELTVRKFLFAQGFRYRLHDKRLPGSPDIILPKYKTIIFVHGCFFHGHEGCRYFVIPKTRTEWWVNKINANRARDQEKTRLLQQSGWQVIVVYECELKPRIRDITLQNLVCRIRNKDS